MHYAMPVCAGSLSLQTVPERGPESLDPGGGCPAPRECQVSHYLPNSHLCLFIFPLNELCHEIEFTKYFNEN